MKWNEFTYPPARNEVLEGIKNHQEVLRTHLMESSTLARKYLLIVNAGAAVALIAFMGNSPKIRESKFSWICLAVFVIGVILVGVLSALDYQIKVAQFRAWSNHSKDFFKNKIDLDAVYASLDPVEKKFGYWPAVAGYLAFGCFIVGGSLALGKFLHAGVERNIGGVDVVGTAPICALNTKGDIMYCDFYSQEHCEASKGLAVAAKQEFCVPKPD
jgi:hypothetical protein